MKVYRDFDQAALDDAYNNRKHVPEHLEIIERWQREGQIAYDDAPFARELAYGPHPRQKIDLLMPGRSGTFPVMAFIHGGYWQSLEKRMFLGLSRSFLDQGVAFAAIGYPLCPDVTMGALVASVRQAIRWIGAEGAGFGLDPERLHVAGHSAGGHLVAMMMATDWSADGGGTRDPIRSACAISGVYDLEPVRLSYLNETLRLTADDVRNLSPAQAGLASDAPFRLHAGAAELPEFLRQQADYAARLSGAGAACGQTLSDGKNHFTVLEEMGDMRTALHRWLIGQIFG